MFGVPPIIMTLAVNVILQGSILVYTGGAPPGIGAGSSSSSSPSAASAPIPVIALHLGWRWRLVAALLLSKTAFGRHLYALGTSATRGRILRRADAPHDASLAYTISGFTAALAGILLTGYTGQAYLGMGDPYLFTSIAAVAIGGASILGGSGHYLGTDRRRACADHPDRPAAGAQPFERRAAHRLRRW